MWLQSSTRDPRWLQYLKSLLVEILFVATLSVFPNQITYYRSNAVDQESLDLYFSQLKKAIEGNNLMDQACYIYNMDKTGMPLDHK